MYQPEKPVRQNKRSAWENERMKHGVCVKCNNPVCEKSKRFCEEHRAAANAASKRLYESNKELANYRTKISGHRARVRVMVLLGGLFCSHCGEKDYRLLTIDHIDGHGQPIAKRSRHRSGLTTADLYAIERGDIELSSTRVLCANCQSLNEHRRGNRVVYPEIRQAVIEAGGYIGPDWEDGED